eukprot:gene1614-1176_t
MKLATRRYLTTVRCNISAHSGAQLTSLTHALNEIASAKTSSLIDTSLGDNGSLVVKFGDVLQVEIRIAQHGGFSLKEFFRKKSPQIPVLRQYHDTRSGLKLDSTIADGMNVLDVEYIPDPTAARESLREVVVPSSSALYDEMHSTDKWEYKRGQPGVYWYHDANGSLAPYRLIPGARPTFIIFSDQFEALQGELIDGKSKLRIEELRGGLVDRGAGNIVREKLIDLSDFKRLGIGIRFTDRVDLPPFFVHESDSVLDDTIESIQSVRVMGGPSTLVENKYGYSGDCWSEVKAMGSSLVKKTIRGEVTPSSR